MFLLKRPWLFLTMFSVFAPLVLGVDRARAEFEYHAESFEPDEEIQSLTVRIAVGADGDDLAETLALDLGLGFPLWLHPLGRTSGEAAIFGAASQTTTASETAAAGTVVEFTFEPAGDAGDDTLHTSSQLLAGVRLADISRIGFMSRGESNWVLAAYEIEINGSAFAANDEVNASVEAQHEAARTRLGEIAAAVSTMEADAENLRMLVEAGLATDDDRARLEEINEQLLPLAKEDNRLQRQLNGSYPWFEETEFAATNQGAASVQVVRVALMTAVHDGADTHNHVYYRTGGHKYLLSSPLCPLASEEGLQVFRLDLEGGPLTAADLRGHALGMLANDQPYGAAPDRWHPERLVVEVDGQIVYDSQDSELDQQSLKAIRIIPPAHFDGEGSRVANEPIERETFVWFAGRGQGLDLIGGGAADPPDSDWPEPEPGLEYDEEEFANADYHDGFDEDFGPFPGEERNDDWATNEEWGTDSGDWGTDSGDWGTDSGDWGTDSGDWGGGGWESPTSWLDLVQGILDMISGHDDATDPDPIGEAPHIDNVRLVDVGGTHQVLWDVTGDTTNIASFRVEILLLYPHEPGGLAPLCQHEPDAEAWQSSATLSTDPYADAIASDPDNAHLTYLVPWVSAQFIEPIEGVEEPSQPGPARAVVRGIEPLAVGRHFTAQPMGPCPPLLHRLASAPWRQDGPFGPKVEWVAILALSSRRQSQA